MARTKKKPQTKPPRLYFLYINPTKFCNLRCSHCWVAPPHTNSKAASGIDLSLIKRAIGEAIALGLRGIKLTGGEPLLYKDIFEIIRTAKKKGLAVHIETNGTLIDKGTAHDLSKLKVDFVGVSLDSNRSEVHDRIRGKKGSFDLAIKGLKHLIDAGLSNQAIFTLSRQNEDRLFEMPSFARKLGANSLKINIVQPMSRGESLSDKGLVFSVPEYIKTYKKFEKRFLSPGSEKTLPIFYDIPFPFMNLEAMKVANNFGLCYIHNILGILSDGKVSICGIGFVKNNLIFGDLFKQSLDDIWSNARLLNKIREDIPGKLEGICRSCFFKSTCRGRCIALSFYRTGKHNQSYFFCEEAFRLGLFPQTRMLSPKEMQRSKLDLLPKDEVADL